MVVDLDRLVFSMIGAVSIRYISRGAPDSGGIVKWGLYSGLVIHTLVCTVCVEG